MKPSEAFFKKQVSEHTETISRLQKSLLSLSLLRLFIFIVTVLAVYVTFGKWLFVLGISLGGISLFLVILSKYTDLKIERDLHQRVLSINEEELKILEGNYKHRPQGLEYQNPNHPYSLDIDLFGSGSFFQYINRTSIKESSDLLANLLLSNNINDIIDKQEAIKELASKPKWHQNYSAIAQGIEVEYKVHAIIDWLRGYQPFLGKLFKNVPMIFSLTTIGIIGLSIFRIIPLDAIGYWLLLGLIITGFYLKRINVLANNIVKLKETFKQYSLLLQQIENEKWASHFLQNKSFKIQREGSKASKIFLDLSRLLDALDNRNNLFSAIFGNGFLLWDLKQVFHIESWIKKHTDTVEDWFNVVTFFDAYNSLGNFAFIHEDYCFPKIAQNNIIIDAKELGHPLLKNSKRVTSDVQLEDFQFFIITGANMAGKSTFLRTVSLHIVMANMGLPVCASSSNYKPMKLITSMRTSDSLDDDSSYFFSELKRLKFVVDTLNNDTNHFVILDEILKGTNSTDKAIGSKKFVKKLTDLKATGIIATHDLSLTELENNISTIKNYFFDAEIKDDELYFDFKLKKGVCQNMNASFLLNKMDIV